MSDPFIGEIRMCGFNFAPRGWALCNGQILSIAQNSALFSLLGTTYGGNGQTTFALPDLRGRRTIGMGTGAGSNYVWGQVGGAETHELTLLELAPHNHTLMASSASGDQASPGGNALAASTVDSPYSTSSNGTQATLVSSGGGSSPHENRPPFLVVNFAIALQGIFPSRN
ncbi:phage tail protein [Acidovorax sp. Root219]|uniref:phage tail protein n=1 Tax=Acidovorax sp. Root219 TaxID=1736493 RepID=UPI00070E7A18|nr:tail fiber protein [Acidovorax sp. Root219]KRC28727.1 phage tail protein [Acidovorax sp. Root219]